MTRIDAAKIGVFLFALSAAAGPIHGSDLPQGKLPKIETVGAFDIGDETWDDSLCSSVLRTPQAGNIMRAVGDSDYVLAGRRIFTDKGPARKSDAAFALFKLSWPGRKLNFFASVTYPYDGQIVADGRLQLGFGVITIWDKNRRCSAGVGRGVVVRIANDKRSVDGIWEAAPTTLPDGAFAVIGTTTGGHALLDLVHRRIMQVDPESATLRSIWTYDTEHRPLFWDGAEKAYTAILGEPSGGWTFAVFRAGRKQPTYNANFPAGSMLIGRSGRYASLSRVKESGAWVVGVDRDMTRVANKAFYYLYGAEDWQLDDVVVWPDFDSNRIAVSHRDGTELRVIDMNARGSVRSIALPDGLAFRDIAWVDGGKVLVSLVVDSKSGIASRVRFVEAASGAFQDKSLLR